MTMRLTSCGGYQDLLKQYRDLAVRNQHTLGAWHMSIDAQESLEHQLESLRGESWISSRLSGGMIHFSPSRGGGGVAGKTLSQATLASDALPG